MMYVLLILGFVLLIKGADFFVEGASSAARLMRVPAIVVGLTIVAMGTSAPEASVSITAGLAGSNDLALSNIIGSNLFNLMVVLGVCAVMTRVPVASDVLRRDFPWNIGASVLLIVCLLDLEVSRLEGFILFAAMVVYLFILVRLAISSRTSLQEPEGEKLLSPFRCVVYIIGGLIAIILGGNLVVDNAQLIAAAWGMSQTLIGLTIVAMGTSLPELVTSITAARKGEMDLAIGNVIGSNIFNILFIGGIASMIVPNVASGLAFIDSVILLIVTIGFFFICYKKRGLGRKEGILMLIAYAVYLGYIIMR